MPLRRKEETDVRMHDVEDEDYVWCPFCGNQNLNNVCYCNNCNNTLIMTTSNVEGHFLRIGIKSISALISFDQVILFISIIFNKSSQFA